MKILTPERTAGRILEQLLRQEGFTPLSVSYAKSYAEKRHEKEKLEANRQKVANVVFGYLQDHSAVTSVDIGDAIFLIGKGSPITSNFQSHLGEYTTPSGNRYLREDTRFKHMTLSEAIQTAIVIPEGDKISIASRNDGIRPNNAVYYTDKQALSAYIRGRLEEPIVVTTHHLMFSTTPIKKVH